MFKIDSLNNPTVKDLVRLEKTSVRKEKGLIIIDGAREISLAVKSGLKIEKLFYCPGLVKEKSVAGSKFFGVATEKIVEVAQPVFNKICYKENPDGFLAVVAKPSETVLADFKPEKNPLIIVLENVEKRIGEVNNIQFIDIVLSKFMTERFLNIWLVYNIKNKDLKVKSTTSFLLYYDMQEYLQKSLEQLQRIKNKLES
jgi:hypothetical protein